MATTKETATAKAARLEKENADLQAKLTAKETELQAKSATVTSAALALGNAEKEKKTLGERIDQLDEKLEKMGNGVNNTVQDAGRAAEKVNYVFSRKWVGVVLAILFLATLGWALFLLWENNKLQNSVTDSQHLRVDNENAAASDSAGRSVSALREQTSQITEMPTADVKKNGKK